MLKTFITPVCLLNKDNMSIPVSLKDWAKSELDSKTYKIFLKDYTAVENYFFKYIDNGNTFISKFVFEEFILTNGELINFPVAVEMTFDENLPMPTQLLKWEKIMSEDPNVIFFEPRQRTFDGYLRLGKQIPAGG